MEGEREGENYKTKERGRDKKGWNEGKVTSENGGMEGEKDGTKGRGRERKGWK